MFISYSKNIMNIRILKNSGRRCAWTDRKNGYFDFLYDSVKENNGGYFRGEEKYFTGFTLSGHTCSESKYVDVYPQGFCASFDDIKLNASLLIEEQAFYISGAKNPGLFGINSKYFEEQIELSSAKEKLDIESVKKTVKKIIQWHTTVIDGITVVSSSTGLAVAGNFDFYYKTNDNTLELYYRSGCSDFDEKSNNPFDLIGWYITFENTEKEAIEKAIRLAKQKGIKEHCILVNNFLDKCKFESGDKKFDESIQWARFSGWMLATMDHDSSYRGIWAGLPWFRDNWGRDTFISLNGILLSSGCFEEAKDVLFGFAGFQDLNKDSPCYGRIPNRYRSSDDVIYNTADGTLWFIRALWEYIQYSGDEEILSSLNKTVEIALDADIGRTDERGFLTHGDADTWMDARIKGDQPWSPRGNRANDIQALWFTALKLGSYLMARIGNDKKSIKYNKQAEKVKKSFSEFFWSEDNDALADHLPEGGYGEWAKDMRVRPNQLFAVTVSKILPNSKDLTAKEFVNEKIASSIYKNVTRELVNPFGLFSLSPKDPIFHPKHENPDFYHKDAAYHNGTIWEWNTGAYISTAAILNKGYMPQKACAILQNESKMIMDCGCAGSLSETIHAQSDEDGNPVLSGTFSQAWSVAEFVRNIIQDVIGFTPRLIEKEIELKPCLPINCKEFAAEIPFGRNWTLEVDIIRKSKDYKCKIIWKLNGDSSVIPNLTINGKKICAEKEIEIKVKSDNGSYIEKFCCPSKWIKSPFEEQKLEYEWTGSIHQKDYLEKLILSQRMKSKTCGGENTAALEWYFDSKEFKEKYVSNIDLGALYSKNSTKFRLWAPTATNVNLILYADGNNSEPKKTITMLPCTEENVHGVWEVVVDGDLHCTYYEYSLYVHGVYAHSADPCAHACGVNGKRSMVVDMVRTNPEDWDKVVLPKIKSPCDVIAYEAHVADISSSPYWNGSKKNKRLYTGVVEEGTKCNGFESGFDHIKKLGITHIQLLPVFDFSTVDEAKADDKDYREKPIFGAFNWGYDPQNYGVPEGSYSSDPFHGEVRIREFKKMVKAFADSGIGIVMDVVFNHVNNGLHQSLGICVPGYFFRVEGYSGAGEDTASEREMFSRYMVDTLSFWLKEYKLCGFRFDLMGLHDVKTMNDINKALRKIKEDVLIYGEGWNMYNAGKMESASQLNASKMPGVGHFNDAVRCAIKGPVFDDKEPGFIHNGNRRESIKFGIVGATSHPQVDNSKVEGTVNPMPWSEKTLTSINYTEIHDNITLNDKIRLVEENKPENYYEQLVKMAISIVILSEGMPILHAGMEFMRTKQIPQHLLDSGTKFYDVAKTQDGKYSYFRNTYNVCDEVNGLDWERCSEKQDIVNYVRNLISLRKEHPVFRIESGKTVSKNLEFLDNHKEGLPEEVLGWNIKGENTGDKWKETIILANPLNIDVKFKLPNDKKWNLITDGVEFIPDGEMTLDGGVVVIIKPKTVSIFATR